MKTFKTVLKESIHYPASYYLCSGYVPELGIKLEQIIKEYQATDISKTLLIYMNGHTYNWLFRLFNYPCEQIINPLAVTPNGQFLFTVPIIITDGLEDGMIVFNTGGDIELDEN